MMPPHAQARPATDVTRRVLAATGSIVLAAFVAAAPLRAQGQANEPVAPVRATATDSAAAVAVVHELHAMLERGDSAAVLALLAPELVVLESGGFEDRAEFRAHHLPADIAFARAVQSERRIRAVEVAGDVAWVASTSVTQGEFRGRTINSSGAELIVLRRFASGWTITAIHWSSRARRG